jgi:2-dehydropantoate 2-reductase
MRLAIMGAGGLGGYIGARLALAGEDVAFIARGAHLAAMKSNGLRIVSPTGNVHLRPVIATDTPAEIGPVDLILFTVKLWDSEAAAKALGPMVGTASRVVTLQNGIDSVDLLARFIPRPQIVAGLTYIPAAIAEPGVIRSPGGQQRIIVDRKSGDAIVTRLKEACDQAVGLSLDLSSTIDTDIWKKFVGFAAFSAATTLMRSTAGPILANAESTALLRQLVDEGVSIAAASGVDLGATFADDLMGFYRTFPAVQRSSMAEDVDRGRPLELRWISGRMHALGRDLNVPTPAHTAAYRGLVLHASGSR